MVCAAKPEATSLVLVEEFAHRVLNEYTQAIAGLSRAARQADNENVRRQLTDAADRLYAHATAHRVLAMPAVEARCDVAEYITRVCSAVSNALLSETDLRLNLGEVEAVLPSDQCWRLALIVSELIHNAARHGGHDGEIQVDLSIDAAHLVCQVTNSGACRSAPTLGRGRLVVAALARELGGSADWLFTPAGACAVVIVPLDPPFSAELQ